MQQHQEKQQWQQDDRLIDSAAAREIFSVGRHTLWRWRRAGILPYVTIGGLVRYRRSDVQRLVAGGLE